METGIMREGDQVHLILFIERTFGLAVKEVRAGVEGAGCIRHAIHNEIPARFYSDSFTVRSLGQGGLCQLAQRGGAHPTAAGRVRVYPRGRWIDPEPLRGEDITRSLRRRRAMTSSHPRWRAVTAQMICACWYPMEQRPCTGGEGYRPCPKAYRFLVRRTRHYQQLTWDWRVPFMA